MESIREEHNGATELKDSIDGALDKVNSLKLSKSQLEEDYSAIVNSANDVLDNLNKIGSLTGNPNSVNVDTGKLKESLSSLNSHLSEYSNSHPEVLNDENFKKKKKFSEDINNLNNNSTNLQGTFNNTPEIKAINESIGALKVLINTLNNKKDTVINDLDKFNSGISEIENGLKALDSGLGKSLAGGEEISSKVPEISNALNQIANGQSKIQDGFKRIFWPNK